MFGASFNFIYLFFVGLFELPVLMDFGPYFIVTNSVVDTDPDVFGFSVSGSFYHQEKIVCYR
jgi:hypothetical protein